MMIITLTQGQGVLVDDDDFPVLSLRKWYLTPNGYVKSTARTNGRQVYMHREIMELEFGDGRQIDHINHNRSDNRKENLRIVTLRQNSENRVDLSKYGCGIRFDSRRISNPFIAITLLNGKRRHIGVYPTAQEARAGRIEYLRKVGVR